MPFKNFEKNLDESKIEYDLVTVNGDDDKWIKMIDRFRSLIKEFSKVKEENHFKLLYNKALSFHSYLHRINVKNIYGQLFIQYTTEDSKIRNDPYPFFNSRIIV